MPRLHPDAPLAAVPPAGTLPMLARNVTHFVRLLRDAGFALSPAQAVDTLLALQYVDIGRRDEVRAAMAALMVSGPDQRLLFDAAFDLFWRDPDWEGKLRALAVVGSDKRLRQLPQVPTLAELGLGKLNAPGWTGVVVRQGTPPAVVAQLHAAVVKAVQSPEVMERFGEFAVTPAPQSPAEFSRFIQSETERWGQVIKAVGVTLD